MATLDAEYWDRASLSLANTGHYLDGYLGALKARAYLELILRWMPSLPAPLLKTDLFEESNGLDALLWRIPLPDDSLWAGMDLSPHIALQSAVNAPRAGGSFLTADARQLPFVSGSLGFVLSPSTLDHFRDPADLHVSLREIRRALRPGGTLIITLDNRSNIGDPLLRLAIRLGLVPYYVGRSYTARELREELERAGFTVQAQTAIVHNPRMMATALARLTRILRWRPLTAMAHRLLASMQRLESTRWRYATGCFVAALATTPAVSLPADAQTA